MEINQCQIFFHGNQSFNEINQDPRFCQFHFGCFVLHSTVTAYPAEPVQNRVKIILTSRSFNMSVYKGLCQKVVCQKVVCQKVDAKRQMPKSSMPKSSVFLMPKSRCQKVVCQKETMPKSSMPKRIMPKSRMPKYREA